jgi:integration host factor subunit alpha
MSGRRIQDAAVADATVLAAKTPSLTVKAGTNPETPPSLTRAGLSETLVGSLGFSRSKAEAVLSKMLRLIQDGIVDEGQVKLVGFGTFETREKAARPGRNPRTGELAEVSARRVVRFRPSPALRQRLSIEA